MKPTLQKGFTLLELLILLVVIAALVAILYPIFAKAREAARQRTCLGNLKQIGMAYLMYAEDYDGALCPAPYPISNMTVTGEAYCGSDWRGLQTATIWNNLLYPYVKDWNIFVCPSWYSPGFWKGNWLGGDLNNAWIIPDKVPIDIFTNGLSPGFKRSTYGVNWGPYLWPGMDWKNTYYAQQGYPAPQIDEIAEFGTPVWTVSHAWRTVSVYPAKYENIEDPSGTIIAADGWGTELTIAAWDSRNEKSIGVAGWSGDQWWTDGWDGAKTLAYDPCQKDNISYRHNGGANTLFADGRAKWMKRKTIPFGMWTSKAGD
jgi:prepilin-type processing-associated H-X9-DG protein/prepilin-type N-terminal cleavage/methylation domain-containing protein